ncbi:MAG TPA: integrase core domain-containing protein [Acidimicrobiales bacterium]|nr:integrase core domain-containing protein [Acidimicrobiales bacterium]
MGLRRRRRAAGVLGSMGSIGDAYDNAMAESFFSTLQRELLDEQRWENRRQFALAVFKWIEVWYNPRRRHSSIGDLSPIDYEARFTPAAAAA